MKKQPEVTAITRQNLIEAFWSLYCQKSIDKITIKEITNLAGYNRSTFYEYFLDVYDVLHQMESELLPSLDRLPLSNFPQNNMGYDYRLFKYYEENSKYLTVLLGEHGDPSFLPKMKKSVIPIIKKGVIEKGAANDYRLDVLIEYNISAMLGVFNLWFTTEEKPTLDEFIKFIHEIKKEGEANILNELIKNK